MHAGRLEVVAPEKVLRRLARGRLRAASARITNHDNVGIAPETDIWACIEDVRLTHKRTWNLERGTSTSSRNRVSAWISPEWMACRHRKEIRDQIPAGVGRVESGGRIVMAAVIEIVPRAQPRALPSGLKRS